MGQTYGPRATFDLPSGSEGARRIVEMSGIGMNESMDYMHGKYSYGGLPSGVPSSDLLEAIADAVREELGIETNDFTLWSIQRTPARVMIEVKL